MIRDVHPGSGSWCFTHPRSRGQKGTGSRIRISNTDIWTCCCAADSTTPLSVVVRKATVKKTGSSSQLCYRMEAKPRYLPSEHAQHCEHIRLKILTSSVPDPVPYDQHVFGPPRSVSGSVSHKYRSGWGSRSGSVPFPLKVLSGLKSYKNFLAENLIFIINHNCTILKLLNFID